MSEAAPKRKLIVGIGGTQRAGSSSEQLLDAVLNEARERGAETHLFHGRFLAGLPLFDPVSQARSDAETFFVEQVRKADGVVIATPGYHGGVSGLVKNALDLLEDLRGDDRPYLDGRPVAAIVTAGGWQGAGVTVSALRDIVHALRGWPTPASLTINSATEEWRARRRRSQVRDRADDPAIAGGHRIRSLRPCDCQISAALRPPTEAFPASPPGSSLLNLTGQRLFAGTSSAPSSETSSGRPWTIG